MILAVLLTLQLLDGRAVDPFAGGQKATAFVFIHPDCPVSSRYAPELNRLSREYASRGIRFFVVYPGRDDDEAAIRTHYAEYGLEMPALRDRQFRLVDMARATMTPEAVVFDRERRLVYRGRIDDRAVRIGVWRATARRRELADVLDRLARSERVESSTTQAVGCYIKPLS
ncbi:MAG: redoxin family protein [Steroidobacteraceae bacterium]